VGDGARETELCEEGGVEAGDGGDAVAGDAERRPRSVEVTVALARRARFCQRSSCGPSSLCSSEHAIRTASPRLSPLDTLAVSRTWLITTMNLWGFTIEGGR